MRVFIVFDWLIVSLILYKLADAGGLRTACQGAVPCGRLGSPSTQGALERSGKIQREGVLANHRVVGVHLSSGITRQGYPRSPQCFSPVAGSRFSRLIRHRHESQPGKIAVAAESLMRLLGGIPFFLPFGIHQALSAGAKGNQGAECYQRDGRKVTRIRHGLAP